MNAEFFEALAMLEKERGLPADYLLEKIKNAIVIAVKKDYEVEDENVSVVIEPDQGKFSVSLLKTVVEEVEDPATEISLEEAQQKKKSCKAGDEYAIPLKTKDFGRIAAQTAKHVIRQGLKEAERSQMYAEMQSKAHEIISAVVTNIEADHLDHYGTLENIEKTFCKFMDLVGEDGTVVIFGDNPHYVELARSTGRHVVTYGFGEGADFRCVPVEASGSHRLASTFDVVCPGGHTVRVTIKANPGRHNMANATAAIAVADAVGADLDAAAAALSEFKGARRRFTHVADIDGVTVVDDYGHHPTEVAATLGAASELGFDRIVCVFQPHRYSRTQSLAADFGRAFDAADVLRVMDVFSAGEQPIPGVSGKTVVNSVREHDASKDVEYVPNRHELVDALVELVRPGDLLITQGAGDVTTIGPAFVEAMRARDAKRA